jgi:hypothetical protein
VNRDQFCGRLVEVRAKLLQLASACVGYDKLVARARTDFNIGRAQARFGDAKSAVQRRRLAAGFGETRRGEPSYRMHSGARL